MVKNWVAYLLIVLTTCISVSWGDTANSTESMCNSLTPSYGTFQTGSAPYRIVVQPSDYASPDGRVTATITGNKAFQGFFIRLRQEGRWFYDGEFDDGHGHKDMCYKKAVTHRDLESKYNVRLGYTFQKTLWGNGDGVNFEATIVEDREKLWNITSSSMTVKNALPRTTPSNTVTSRTSLSTPASKSNISGNSNNLKEPGALASKEDHNSGVILDIHSPLFVVALVSLVLIWFT